VGLRWAILKEVDAVHGAIKQGEEQANNLSERSLASYCERFILLYSADGLHHALLLRTYKPH